jgi:hypothetical protein
MTSDHHTNGGQVRRLPTRKSRQGLRSLIGSIFPFFISQNCEEAFLLIESKKVWTNYHGMADGNTSLAACSGLAAARLRSCYSMR